MIRFPAILSAFVGVLASGPALADLQDGHGPGMMWQGGGHGWFMGPFMMVFFLILAVVATVLIVRWLGGLGHGGRSDRADGDRALAVLRERFARGEIDADEYESRRGVLQG
ncbi:MAG: hypothetical protein HOH66_02730 [Rhodospirillaceae bacterium]|jgi:putative membrane protein|nr:hypothetical protein [Rhodospirillaceae bacterium]MBT6116763.1 hypothetical protein [Rhodospirillaceae bacterium]